MIKPPFKVLKSHLTDAFFITADKLYREFEEPLEAVDRFRRRIGRTAYDDEGTFDDKVTSTSHPCLSLRGCYPRSGDRHLATHWPSG